MCYFITIVIPQYHAATLKEALPRKLRLSPSSNPSVEAWLKDDNVAFYLTTSMCSCDLYGGRVPADSEEEPDLRRKYQRKGWSEAKIQRALSQASAARERTAGIRTDLAPLLCSVAARTGRMSLLVHWYSGDVDAEQISIRGRATYRCGESAESICEDTLIDFVPGQTQNPGTA